MLWLYETRTHTHCEWAARKVDFSHGHFQVTREMELAGGQASKAKVAISEMRND